jgi:nucleoside-triphosphatase THEP1
MEEKGFSLIPTSKALIASANIKWMLKGLRPFSESIPFLNPSTRLIVIDEIGKMECFLINSRPC